MTSVRQERTGWRDEAISHRHREWGYDCPAVDVDFLMVEYDNGLPAALVEYKAIGARVPNFQSATIRALTALANASRIPLFVVYYNNELWWTRVTPVNTYAKQYVSSMTTFSEVEYVSLLYRVRNKVLPDDIRRTLNTVKPRN